MLPSPSEKPSTAPSSPPVLAHTLGTSPAAENPFDSPFSEDKEAYDVDKDDAASIMSRRAERRFLRKLDVLRESSAL
jgi:hypothetical protein